MASGKRKAARGKPIRGKAPKRKPQRKRAHQRVSRRAIPKAHPESASFYASLPKTTYQTRSIRIPLSTKSQPPSPAHSLPPPDSAPHYSMPSRRPSPSSAKMHYYSSLGFLAASVWGFIFALKFAAQRHWLFFLISMGVFIIGADNIIISLRNARAEQGRLTGEHVTWLHRFSAHVFFLFALIGIVFGITFWLQGQWLMLLLSLAVVVIGLDNMWHAKRNHHGSA
ncbi:hypothetical protein J4435_03290 [Candidatus Woesearchaeota archaeon]|nr:hypothetical protein [Candidatus Woesearchaeota archaeon]